MPGKAIKEQKGDEDSHLQDLSGLGQGGQDFVHVGNPAYLKLGFQSEVIQAGPAGEDIRPLAG